MNTRGLGILTTPEEMKEVIAVMAYVPKPSLEARAKLAEIRGRRIIFAFFQDDFQGGKIPYFHVTDPFSKSYSSTLSIEGLKYWKVNMRASHRR